MKIALKNGLPDKRLWQAAIQSGVWPENPANPWHPRSTLFWYWLGRVRDISFRAI
jgi:hypothetical protein